MANPTPREEISRYEPIIWPHGAKTTLAPRSRPLETDLVALLEQRQTRREFSSVLTDIALGEFLWLTCRSRSSKASVYGPDQESRPAPSAGAMHPIHVLLARAGGPWLRYDPVGHALVEVLDTEQSAAAVRGAAGKLVSVDQGLIVALVAEPGRTGAKYTNPESLVWRDAGVLLGYMSLVAEALSLSFCPLGLTGDPDLANVLGKVPGLHGAGLAILGI